MMQIKTVAGDYYDYESYSFIDGCKILGIEGVMCVPLPTNEIKRGSVFLPYSQIQCINIYE